MKNLSQYVAVDELTDEHIGLDAAVVYVNYGEDSYPTFGTVERHFDHRTGEPGVAFVTDGRHFARNAEYPNEDVRVSHDTEARLYVIPKESPDA